MAEKKKKQAATAPPEEEQEQQQPAAEPEEEASPDALASAEKVSSENTNQETEPEDAPGEATEAEPTVENAAQTPENGPENGEDDTADQTPPEDERAALERERAELEREKLAFAHQQLVASVASVLQDKGIPVEFAPWITGSDAETSAANVEALEGALGKYFDLKLAERMRGGDPPRARKEGTYDRDKLKGMSAAEINAHWAEIAAEMGRK